MERYAGKGAIREKGRIKMGKNLAMGFINRVLETPLAWNISQFVLGGNANKQKLYRSLFTLTGKLMDFGCADGNTFTAFKDFDYYGVDIDTKFIDYARNKYKDYENAHWVAADILNNPFEANTFDYILFAGTGHHIPDDKIHPILNSLINMTRKKGKLYIIDIVSKPESDTWWKKLLIRFDQGQFTRTQAKYQDMLYHFQDRITLISTSTRKMRGNFFPLPDFFIAVLEKK